MTSGRIVPEDIGQIGSRNWPGRFWLRRLLGFIFSRDFIRVSIPCGARPSLSINIKGHCQLRVSNRSKNISFYLFSFALTFPIYYLLFMLRLYVDWGHSWWPADPRTNQGAPTLMGSLPGGCSLVFALLSWRNRSGRFDKAGLAYSERRCCNTRPCPLHALVLSCVGPEFAPTGALTL